jgi:hypothetical protein
MNEREELQALRRLAELEARAASTGEAATATATPPATTEYDPSEGGGELRPFGIDTGLRTPQVVDRALAGIGKAFTDLGRGTGQYVGAVSRQDVADSRQRDAALMRTGSGKAGNFVGNVAATLPALAIPGANTVAGAGLVGTVMGAAQPSTSTTETLLNTGLGGAMAAVGQYVGGKVSNAATNRLAARQAQAAEAQALNAARDRVLKDAMTAGYGVPPTATNPTAINTALESLSGKAATRQALMAKNALVTDSLVRGDLGITPTTPLTRSALDGVIRREGRVYAQVKAAGAIPTDAIYRQRLANVLSVGNDIESAYPGIGAKASAEIADLVKSLDVPSHSAEKAVGAFKFLNEQSKNNFTAARMGGGSNSQALELARAQRVAADAMGELIDRHMNNTGQAALAQQWTQARTTIAKAYQAQSVLKGGHVDAGLLANQLRKGKPLSGGMGLAAQFADHFGDVARVPKSGAGVSKLAATLASGGVGYSLATGNPLAAAGATAIAAAPYAIRGGMLSGLGQRALAVPNYLPNRTGTALLQGSGGLGRNMLGITPALSLGLGPYGEQQEPL